MRYNGGMGMVAAGAYLRAHRERLGLSQGDVAKALGLSQAKVVTDWEKGRRRPLAHAWNLWVDMVKANPQTAHELVLRGRTADEGTSRAQQEFVGTIKKLSRGERDLMVAVIQQNLDRLLAEDKSVPKKAR